MNTYAKYIGIGLSVAICMVPAALALAEDGGGEHEGAFIQPSIGVDVGANAALRTHGDSNEDINENVNSSSTVKDSEDDPGAHGEKKGLLKHFGTTTPPGIERNHDATTSDEGAVADHEGKGQGGIRTAFTSFISWLFGLPATTTVGDIRAQIDASTTASTTAQSQNNLGFFARLFGFFHLGR